MPKRKELNSIDAVLAILREVRGIVEAAALAQSVQVPMPGNAVADVERLDDEEIDARAEAEARDWMRHGTGRST